MVGVPMADLDTLGVAARLEGREISLERILEAARALAKRHWPGPLTLVVPARQDLPPEVVGVAEARHLWVGEKFVRRALDEVVRVVAPERAPVDWRWEQ